LTPRCTLPNSIVNLDSSFKKIKATMNARSQVFEIAVEARQVEEAVARSQLKRSMNLQSDIEEYIKGGDENSSISLHELPAEILMKIFKILPNQQWAVLEFGLTCRRFWNIMLASREPKEPSLLLIRNQAIAEKIFKWKETLSYVSVVGYDVYEQDMTNGNRHVFYVETGCYQKLSNHAVSIGRITNWLYPSVCVTLMLNLEMETTKHVEYIFQNYQKFCSKSAAK
jgi:hypothetical protein